MRIKRRGVKFIAGWELFLSCPYWDDYGKVWTIGYGETEGISRNTPCISKATARRNLRRKLNGQYLDPLRELARETGIRFRQREISALVSGLYNLGPGYLTDSTLGRRLRSKEGKTYRGRKRIYRHEIPRWNRAGGRVLAGLTARRNAEVRLACRGNYSSEH